MNNLYREKMPHNSEKAILNKLNLENIDIKNTNKKYPKPYLNNKCVKINNINDKHVHFDRISSFYKTYLEFSKSRSKNLIELGKFLDSKSTNRTTGLKSRRERGMRRCEHTERSPEAANQDGGDSQTNELTRVSHSKQIKLFISDPTTMESESERRERCQEEDELVREVSASAKIRAIKIEREERMAMLRRLSDKKILGTTLSKEEVDKILTNEKKRTMEINQAVFMALQNQDKNRTYYNDSILHSEKGIPEYEIFSMVTLRKLTEDITTEKPINLNLTMDGNTIAKHVMFIEESDVVIPGEVQEMQPEVNSAKPKIIGDIQLKSAIMIQKGNKDISNDRERSRDKASSSEHN